MRPRPHPRETTLHVATAPGQSALRRWMRARQKSCARRPDQFVRNEIDADELNKGRVLLEEVNAMPREHSEVVRHVLQLGGGQ